MFRRNSLSTRHVIRLPNVAPKDELQAQWSHTLPLDFAETLPTAIHDAEDEPPSGDEKPGEA